MNAKTTAAVPTTFTATAAQLEGLVTAAVRTTVEGVNVDPTLMDDLIHAVTEQVYRYGTDLEPTEGSLTWHILSALEASGDHLPATTFTPSLTQDRADLFGTLDSLLAAGYILESTRKPHHYVITGKGVVALEAQEAVYPPLLDLTPGTVRRDVLAHLDRHKDRFHNVVEAATAADTGERAALLALDELVEAGYVHRRAINQTTFCITAAGERALRQS